MSQSELDRFVSDLKTDAALRAEVAKGESVGAIVAVAARHGYGVTLDEAKAHLKSRLTARAAAAGRSLSGEELDAIAAGSTHQDLRELAEKMLERISGGGSGTTIKMGETIGGVFVPTDFR